MLSPLLKPQALNGGMISSSKLTNALYGSNDALDKRNSSSFANIVSGIDAARDVAETIANSLGIRSPYFVIGEIPKNTNGNRYIWSSFDKPGTGIVRAVTNATAFFGVEQPGVIIDCLGDVNAEMSVEFTSKPLVYLSNSVVDSRVRKPTVIRATVAISNYLADDARGMLLNQAASWDPTGAADLIRDELLYEGNTRAQYGLYKLRWLMENAKPFTVYTPHGYYENMLIQSLKPQTTESTMDMLLCDIVYQEAILSAPYAWSANALTNRTPTKTVVNPNESGVKSNFAKIIGG